MLNTLSTPLTLALNPIISQKTGRCPFKKNWNAWSLKPSSPDLHFYKSSRVLRKVSCPVFSMGPLKK